MSRPSRLALVLILLVSLLIAGLRQPVWAQGSTILAIDPTQASVEVNGQREIALLVSGADSLNAFDLQVEYDAGLLSLAGWEFGDLLSNLAVVKRDDLPGSFRLVATQLATTGASGDGVLLTLTFRGKLEGSSAINITKAEFARSGGGLSLPELQQGRLSVIAAKLTATFTQVPTASATIAPTATATHTATRTTVPTLTNVPPTVTPFPAQSPLPTRVGEVGTSEPLPTSSPADGGQPTGEEPAAVLPPSQENTPAPPGEEANPEPDLGLEESAPPDEKVESRRESAMNSLLTGIFIVSLIAVIVMFYILLKRRKNKEEDLLL